MKKSLISLLVLACVAPAMAVTVTLSENPAGTLEVNYALDAGETNVRGLALVFDVVSGDAKLNSVSAGAFNTFIDYAIDAVGYELGQGHPVADPDAAGAIDPATTPTKFAVSMGYLDEAGAQAGLGNGSFSIAYTGTVDSNVTVSVDTLRGGIVGDDVAGVTITNPTITLHFATPPCLGDLSGDGAITTQDLGLVINMLGAAGAPYVIPSTSPAYNPLADMDSNGAVTTQDLGLVINILGAAGSPYVVPCP